jgi:hypothetical protein
MSPKISVIYPHRQVIAAVVQFAVQLGTKEDTGEGIIYNRGRTMIDSVIGWKVLKGP